MSTVSAMVNVPLPTVDRIPRKKIDAEEPLNPAIKQPGLWWLISMVNLTNYVCIQLKPKQLGMPVRDFLHWIPWSRETHHKSGPHLPVAAHIKGRRRGKILLFTCLSSLSLASSSFLLLRHSFVSIPSSGLQHRLTSSLVDWARLLVQKQSLLH